MSYNDVLTLGLVRQGKWEAHKPCQAHKHCSKREKKISGHICVKYRVFGFLLKTQIWLEHLLFLAFGSRCWTLLETHGFPVFLSVQIKSSLFFKPLFAWTGLMRAACCREENSRFRTGAHGATAISGLARRWCFRPFLSSDARDRELLKQHNITHILSIHDTAAPILEVRGVASLSLSKQGWPQVEAYVLGFTHCRIVVCAVREIVSVCYCRKAHSSMTFTETTLSLHLNLLELTLNYVFQHR